MDIPHASRRTLDLLRVAPPAGSSCSHPVLHAPREQPPAPRSQELSPSVLRRRAGRWRSLVNYFTRFGQKSFLSGRWPPLKANPDPWVLQRSSQDRGPGGSAEPAELEEQREPAGRGGCCAPPCPIQLLSGAASCAGSPALGAARRVCSSGIHKRQTPVESGTWTPLSPPTAPSHSCIPAPSRTCMSARCQAEPVQVTLVKLGLAGWRQWLGTGMPF